MVLLLALQELYMKEETKASVWKTRKWKNLSKKFVSEDHKRVQSCEEAPLLQAQNS